MPRVRNTVWPVAINGNALSRELRDEVAWGTPQQGRTRNIGTFRENWQLTWRPELDLALIEASMWGSTVAAAAAQRRRSIAADATALDQLTTLTERCLLADLGDALPAVLAAVRDRAALDTDVTHRLRSARS